MSQSQRFFKKIPNLDPDPAPGNFSDEALTTIKNKVEVRRYHKV